MFAVHVLRKYWNLIPFLKKKWGGGGVEFYDEFLFHNLSYVI